MRPVPTGPKEAKPEAIRSALYSPLTFGGSGIFLAAITTLRHSPVQVRASRALIRVAHHYDVSPFAVLSGYALVVVAAVVGAVVLASGGGTFAVDTEGTFGGTVAGNDAAGDFNRAIAVGAETPRRWPVSDGIDERPAAFSAHR